MVRPEENKPWEQNRILLVIYNFRSSPASVAQLLAQSAINRKVVGSSPPGSSFIFSISEILRIYVGGGGGVYNK